MDNKNSVSGRPDGSNPQEGDVLHLQGALRTLIDDETRHIHETVLTDKIVRAVRGTSIGSWGLEDVWSRALLDWFRPVAVIGTLVVLLLMAYNIGRSVPTPFELSTTERVFGMHPVTLATAYDLDLDSAGASE